MKRVPEPELMDAAEQARAYAEEDFSEPNRLFLDCFRELHPATPGALRVLDLGCGPADICLRFARAYPLAEVDALDGSRAMLDLAAQALECDPQMATRVHLLHTTLPCAELAAARYDAVISNSLLHHLHNPNVLWETVREAGRPGATLLIMDLTRPTTAEAAEALVAEYAANAPEVLRNDFRNSLFAAFTPEEVRRQLRDNDLGHLEVARISDRHLTVSGRL